MKVPGTPNLDDRPERASERAQGDLQIKIAALDFWGSERGFWFQVGGWRVFVLPGFRARGLSGDGALLLLVMMEHLEVIMENRRSTPVVLVAVMVVV